MTKVYDILFETESVNILLIANSDVIIRAKLRYYLLNGHLNRSSMQTVFLFVLLTKNDVTNKTFT